MVPADGPARKPWRIALDLEAQLSETDEFAVGDVSGYFVAASQFEIEDEDWGKKVSSSVTRALDYAVKTERLRSSAERSMARNRSCQKT